jgi:hypothetical protein
MDFINFVGRIREHYLDQFTAFAQLQMQNCTKGAAEVKLKLSESSTLYERMYCVDFIRNDDQARVIELQPENILTFDPIEVSFGRTLLIVEYLRWDDVVLHYDLVDLPTDPLNIWFRRWFDPEDERHKQGAAISNVVHSLLVQPNSLRIDLGTADADAFLDILALLENAGATSIRVSSSKAENP